MSVKKKLSEKNTSFNKGVFSIVLKEIRRILNDKYLKSSNVKRLMY